jgi:hypothetical protein
MDTSTRRAEGNGDPLQLHIALPCIPPPPGQVGRHLGKRQCQGVKSSSSVGPALSSEPRVVLCVHGGLSPADSRTVVFEYAVSWSCCLAGGTRMPPLWCAVCGTDGSCTPWSRDSFMYRVYNLLVGSPELTAHSRAGHAIGCAMWVQGLRRPPPARPYADVGVPPGAMFLGAAPCACSAMHPCKRACVLNTLPWCPAEQLTSCAGLQRPPFCNTV